MKRLISCLALAGCATVPTFPEPDSSWSTQSGQLRYTTVERSVIGEFVASRRGDDFRLEFTKGGGVPLLRIARHGEWASAEGAMARGRWRGAAANAPVPLRGWLGAVPAALARASGSGALVEVAGAQPGERFSFIFNR